MNGGNEMTSHAEPVDSPVEWVCEHAQRYVESNGEDGHIWNGVPTLALTTIGRKTGTPRRTMLIYGQDGENYILVASKGGSPEDPQWYRNLSANPDVRVQVGSDEFAARARTVSADEKPRLWQLMAGIWPAYNEYQQKTDRDIPVVVLERA